MAADHRDARNIGAQRQDGAVVLEQHRPLLRALAQDGGVRLDVLGWKIDRTALDGMVDHPLGEHRAQDAPRHLIQPRLGYLARLDGFEEQLTEERLFVEWV